MFTYNEVKFKSREVYMSAVFLYKQHMVKSNHINKTTWFNSLNFRLRGHIHPHNVNKCHVIETMSCDHYNIKLRLSTHRRHICLHITCGRHII